MYRTEEPAAVVDDDKSVEAAPSVPSVTAGRSDDQSPIGQLAGMVRSGDVEGAKAAFVALNDANTVDINGRNAVHFAAEAANSELADFFIRLGTNADAEDVAGGTPLNISAELSDRNVPPVLIKSGAYIHHSPPDGKSPAVVSIESSSGDFLTSLLNHETMLSTDGEGRTILHLAAEGGNPNAVNIILNAADNVTEQEIINKRDRSGMTPLDYAFANRDSRSHATAAELLIAAGGFSSDPLFLYFAPVIRSLNFNQRAADGNSCLHYTVRKEYRGFTRYLLDHKADPNIKNTAGDTPIHEAARIGDLEIIRALLENGASVNIQDGQGNTAMHIAIPVEMHKAMFELLFEYGANPNLRDRRGESPLHTVIGLNRGLDILETLLKNGADVSIHNIDGKTPLYLAVEENRLSLLPLLVSYASDIFAVTNEGSTPFNIAISSNKDALNYLITNETVLQGDNNGNTPLIAAAQAGADADIIQRILDKNALVNARNQEGDTALHIAVRQNLPAVGDLLAARGADVFAQNAKGESPLYLVFYSPGDIRDWLLNPIVLTARDGLDNTVLHHVTQWKLDSAIAMIAAKGASLEAANVTGETPLFIAVKIDSASTVRALLNSGASISGRDTLGNTALHTAVRWNALSATEALVDAKAEINAYNLYGKTPLHDAVRLGVYGMETLLVERGAYLESRDKEGNTPLMEAVLKGSFRSVEHLLNSGSSVYTRNNDGDTPLLVAVEEERSDLVGILLDRGSHIHAKNADGDSPFTIALRTSPRMMLSLLAKGRDQTDDEGRSPLHIALSYNMPEADIKTIAGWLGRTNAVDMEGRTALRYAVDRNNWTAASFLANNGADVFSLARDGKTPADVTLSANNMDAVRAVFGGNAIGARDSSGNTILHYAARVSATPVISLLIELGADKTARNTSGDRSADIAQRWNRQDILPILR
ncbi:MAG: ankyrin repeat domain-containing protein [Spirochaetaceae bacterium]|nr:ankyrin repeat domain-containing protein [Spirochaetaceae bacterium]